MQSGQSTQFERATLTLYANGSRSSIQQSCILSHVASVAMACNGNMLQTPAHVCKVCGFFPRFTRYRLPWGGCLGDPLIFCRIFVGVTGPKGWEAVLQFICADSWDLAAIPHLFRFVFSNFRFDGCLWSRRKAEVCSPQFLVTPLSIVKHRTGLPESDMTMSISDMAMSTSDMTMSGSDVIMSNPDVIMSDPDLMMLQSDVFMSDPDMMSSGSDMMMSGPDMIMSGPDREYTSSRMVSDSAQKDPGFVFKIVHRVITFHRTHTRS